MCRSLLVYIIVFVVSFATYCFVPLQSEYIFKKVATSFNATTDSPSCSNETETSEDDRVTTEASRWTLLLNVTLLVPASLVAILITAWGDHVGRKITLSLPVFGLFLGGVVFSLIVYFDWPLNTFFIYSFTSGSLGYHSTMMIQGAAYISDVTAPDKRGKRFVFLEASVGVGAGIAGVSSGYWLDVSGFIQPIICATALLFVSLVLIFFLPDSKKISQQRNEGIAPSFRKQSFENNIQEKCDSNKSNGLLENYGSCENEKTAGNESVRSYTIADLLRSVWRVYSCDYSRCVECHGPVDVEKIHRTNFSLRKCRHPGGGFPGRTWRMWLYVISENLYEFVLNGLGQIQVIYFLSQPLCFSPLEVGTQQGLKFTLYALSPVLVIFYQRCFGLSNNLIAVSGLVGLLVYSIALSFATSPAVVFAGTGAIFFINTTRPFILAQISTMVLASEQGAGYAMLTFTETISILTGSIVFLLVYPATISVFHGFIWLLGAAILILPITFITIIFYFDKKRVYPTEEEDRPLVT